MVSHAVHFYSEKPTTNSVDSSCQCHGISIKWKTFVSAPSTLTASIPHPSSYLPCHAIKGDPHHVSLFFLRKIDVCIFTGISLFFSPLPMYIYPLPKKAFLARFTLPIPISFAAGYRIELGSVQTLGRSQTALR